MRSITKDLQLGSAYIDLLDEFEMQIMHEAIRFDAHGLFDINMKLVTAVSYLF